MTTATLINTKEGTVAEISSSSMLPRPPHPLVKHKGILYALAGSLFLSSAMLLCKKVKRLTGPEVSLLRTSVMAALTFFQVTYQNQRLFNYKGRRRLLFGRAICSTVGSSALFTSILLISLPDASSVKYCSVVLTPFLARLTLSEHLSKINIASALTSFFGVALIANPFNVFGGGGAVAAALTPMAAATNQTQSQILRHLMIPEMSPSAKMSFGVALALLTSICEAVGYCIGKKLSNSVPKTAIVFNMSTYSIALTFPVCVALRLYMFGRTASPQIGELALIPLLDIDDLGFIILAGVFSMFGHVCVVSALKLENAGLVSIVRASDIIFSHAFQMIFFNTQISQLSVVGSVLIVFSVVAASLWKIRRQAGTRGTRGSEGRR